VCSAVFLRAPSLCLIPMTVHVRPIRLSRRKIKFRGLESEFPESLISRLPKPPTRFSHIHPTPTIPHHTPTMIRSVVKTLKRAAGIVVRPPLDHRRSSKLLRKNQQPPWRRYVCGVFCLLITVSLFRTTQWSPSSSSSLSLSSASSSYFLGLRKSHTRSAKVERIRSIVSESKVALVDFHHWHDGASSPALLSRSMELMMNTR
jgi:hypothetical protein